MRLVMNVLPKSKNVPLWYLIPVALGIHGLILCIPIALDEPVQEKPKSAPVKLQKLPPSKLSTVPKTKSTPLPPGAIVPPPPIASSSASTITQTAAPAAAQQSTTQAPAQTTTPAQPATPQTPAQPATPAQSATPQTPPEEKVSDVFQIAGAVACDNIKECFSTPDTTGVRVAERAIADLNKKGYDTKERADLTGDNAMKIYEVRKGANEPIKYLHIIWGNGKGTRTLILSRRVDDWDELAAMVKL